MFMKTTAHLWLRRGAIGNMIIYSTIAYCCDFLIIIIIIVYEVRGNTYPMHHRVQFHMTIACSSNSPMNPEVPGRPALAMLNSTTKAAKIGMVLTTPP